MAEVYSNKMLENHVNSIYYEYEKYAEAIKIKLTEANAVFPFVEVADRIIAGETPTITEDFIDSFISLDEELPQLGEDYFVTIVESIAEHYLKKLFQEIIPWLCRKIYRQDNYRYFRESECRFQCTYTDMNSATIQKIFLFIDASRKVSGKNFIQEFDVEKWMHYESNAPEITYRQLSRVEDIPEDYIMDYVFKYAPKCCGNLKWLSRFFAERYIKWWALGIYLPQSEIDARFERVRQLAALYAVKYPYLSEFGFAQLGGWRQYTD